MDDTRQRIAEQVLRRYRSGQMSRREAVRLLGALGLTTAGIGAIGLGVINTGSTIAGSAASTRRCFGRTPEHQPPLPRRRLASNPMGRTSGR